MTNAELAILSLVVEQPRHGYDIEQTLVERNMRDWTDVGFSSIYYILGKLETAGLVTSRSEPAPSRRAGEACLRRHQSRNRRDASTGGAGDRRSGTPAHQFPARAFHPASPRSFRGGDGSRHPRPRSRGGIGGARRAKRRGPAVPCPRRCSISQGSRSRRSSLGSADSPTISTRTDRKGRTMTLHRSPASRPTRPITVSPVRSNTSTTSTATRSRRICSWGWGEESGSCTFISRAPTRSGGARQ